MGCSGCPKSDTEEDAEEEAEAEDTLEESEMTDPGDSRPSPKLLRLLSSSAISAGGGKGGGKVEVRNSAKSPATSAGGGNADPSSRLWFLEGCPGTSPGGGVRNEFRFRGTSPALRWGSSEVTGWPEGSVDVKDGEDFEFLVSAAVEWR